MSARPAAIIVAEVAPTPRTMRLGAERSCCRVSPASDDPERHLHGDRPHRAGGSRQRQQARHPVGPEPPLRRALRQRRAAVHRRLQQQPDPGSGRYRAHRVGPSPDRWVRVHHRRVRVRHRRLLAKSAPPPRTSPTTPAELARSPRTATAAQRPPPACPYPRHCRWASVPRWCILPPTLKIICSRTGTGGKLRSFTLARSRARNPPEPITYPRQIQPRVVLRTVSRVSRTARPSRQPNNDWPQAPPTVAGRWEKYGKAQCQRLGMTLRSAIRKGREPGCRIVASGRRRSSRRDRHC